MRQPLAFNIPHMPEFLTQAFANTTQTFPYVDMIFAVGPAIESLAPAERGQPGRHILFNLRYGSIFILIAALDGAAVERRLGTGYR